MSRKDLSLKEKIAILDKVKSLPPGTSQRKIAEKLRIPKSTVAKLLKEEVILRENFKSTQTGNQKRKREGKDPEVDEALSEWWKNRHEIKFKRVHGEKASADESASNNWKVDRLKIILNDFSPDNIFNADETGLYYRATPDGSLCFKKDVLSGSRKAMDRITVLLCVNMTGSDKKKLLVVGKSLKPRCFKNMSINKMPVHYHANKNAWMTSTIFLNWLYEWDKELQEKSRSIPLLIDNCTAHPNNVQLKNITLEFLPPNTTSLIQPLDMGIIKNLKVRYRMKLVNFILEKIEENLFDQSATANQISGKINILQAIQFVSESWREVSCSTIMNCFAHCGYSNFIGPQPELTELDEQIVQNHNEFENIDENAPCFDDNEEICDVVVQNVLKKRKLEDDDEEEEDTEPPVTAREAKKCIDLLQKFFMQEGNENSPSDKLEACAHFVNQIHTKQLRQRTITTFCDSYASLSYLFRISTNTICGIVPEVCQPLSDVLQAKGFLKVGFTFYGGLDYDYVFGLRIGFMEKWNFPRCIGAVDGKHDMIQAPPNSGSEFYNYKGFHSIVLLAVVDFDYKFILVDIGCNGRHNDSSIFLRSEIAPYMEKQLLNMPTQKITWRKVFNYRLSRAKRTVENIFEIASSVFRVLCKPIMLKPNNADRVIFAITCLHNYLRTPFGSLDYETSDGQIQPGTWREEGMPTSSLLSLDRNGPKKFRVTAKDVRNEFMNYFVSGDGELPWQYSHCLLNMETRPLNLA
ncbi:hypothetical protein AGLY_016697 [Aphis glycines]|uniref:DDE-1 domain-containing protein n=1 Tax=Aphis glycines TaxID=307491 RepID=A0A6G0SWY7_APHGL|nr:hypothetical protein AGLY_016697 [Aphis glycines]